MDRVEVHGFRVRELGFGRLGLTNKEVHGRSSISNNYLDRSDDAQKQLDKPASHA
jgi:hypothetical protein